MFAKTADFYLVVFLMCKGLKLEEMESIDTRKMFIFSDTEEYRNLKNNYYSNKATVNPLDFKSKIRELKALIAKTN